MIGLHDILNIRFMEKMKSKKIAKILFAVLLFFSTVFSYAAINKEINYQGKLFNSARKPVNNGDYNIKFRLCTDSLCNTPV
jgi:hypothetical protein